MKKLFVSFNYDGRKLKGYVDGYTPYEAHVYAVIYVPETQKLYSVRTTFVDIIGYREV